MTEASSGTVDVVLELPDDLALVAERAADAVREVLVEERAAVGLPSLPVAVRTTNGPSRSTEVGRWRSDAGTVVLVRDNMVEDRWSITRPGDPAGSVERDAGWSTANLGAVAPDDVVGGLRDAALAAVERDPSTLLVTADVALVLGDEASRGSGASALRGLLARGADLGRLDHARALDLIDGDSEELVASLCPDRVVLRAQPDLVRDLIMGLAGDGASGGASTDVETNELMTTTRSWFLRDTGITLPDVDLVEDELVRPGYVRIGLGPVVGPPISVQNGGLAEEVLALLTRTVGQRVDRLVHLRSTQAVVAAMTTSRSAAVDRFLYDSWDLAHLAGVLHRLACRTGGLAPPDVLATALTVLSSTWCDEDLEHGLRRRTAAYTVYRVCRGLDQQAAVAYLLDADLERRVVAAGYDEGTHLVPEGPLADELVQSLADEEPWSGNAAAPLLVADAAHAFVSAVLRARRPGVRALAYCDLPANQLVQPVTRLGARAVE